MSIAARVALLGDFGGNNLGNELTLRVTIDELRRRRPDVRICCVCANPERIAERYSVETISLDPDPALVWRFPAPGKGFAGSIGLLAAMAATEPRRRAVARRLLAGTTDLIVAGTGLFDDLGTHPLGTPAWLLRWTASAKAVGSRVTLLGVGAGPIEKPLNRVLLRRALALADRRVFRDPYSRGFTGSLGIDVARDEICPDLVFALSGSQLGARPAAPGPGCTIGVGVMAYYGWDADKVRHAELHQRYVATLAQFSASLVLRGYRVRFLAGQVGDDDATIREVQRAAAGILAGSRRDDARPDRIAYEPITSIDDLLRQIELTDVVVATRYHNVIVGLVLGRPTVSIGYSAKFDALMQDLGLEQFNVAIAGLSAEQLDGRLARLLEQWPAVTANVRLRTEQYREGLATLFDSLATADHPH